LRINLASFNFLNVLNSLDVKKNIYNSSFVTKVLQNPCLYILLIFAKKKQSQNPPIIAQNGFKTLQQWQKNTFDR